MAVIEIVQDVAGVEEEKILYHFSLSIESLTRFEG
jgi:hypothetical protein